MNLREAYPFLDDEDFMLLVQRMWIGKKSGEFSRSDQIILHLPPGDDRVKEIEYLEKSSRREKLG